MNTAETVIAGRGVPAGGGSARFMGAYPRIRTRARSSPLTAVLRVENAAAVAVASPFACQIAGQNASTASASVVANGVSVGMMRTSTVGDGSVGFSAVFSGV